MSGQLGSALNSAEATHPSACNSLNLGTTLSLSKRQSCAEVGYTPLDLFSINVPSKSSAATNLLGCKGELGGLYEPCRRVGAEGVGCQRK